jgi:hypothetical protein
LNPKSPAYPLLASVRLLCLALLDAGGAATAPAVLALLGDLQRWRILRMLLDSGGLLVVERDGSAVRLTAAGYRYALRLRDQADSPVPAAA